MSWGPGLTALLGAGALFWTIGNSVRRDTKAEVAALADSTDRKIAALADAIAAMGKVHDREMANIREAQAKNTADIANLEKSVDKLEVKLEKHAAENAKGFAELRESQDKGMAALREFQAKSEATTRESIAKYAADGANSDNILRESIAKIDAALREFQAKNDASIARIEAAVTKH